MAVERCKVEGYVDDALFARLFVESRSRALGNARLVAELVKRGIEREAAQMAVIRTVDGEDERLAAALAKLVRTRPLIGYPTAARALERLGFPAPAIYRHLRQHAAGAFGEL